MWMQANFAMRRTVNPKRAGSVRRRMWKWMLSRVQEGTELGHEMSSHKEKQW